MKTKLGVIFLSLALGLGVVQTAQGSDALKLSPKNTKITWVGTKPNGQHSGGFEKLSGEFNLELGKLSVEIQTPSITSDNNQLTNHLKSPDFFNVRKFPKATFQSTKIEAKSDGEWTHLITGDLTLLGKKRSISFPATIDAMGKTISSTFAIDRTHFGMSYGQGRVDNKVTITVIVTGQ